jgi:hypothetical protein
MAMGISHFMIGMTGGIILIILFPKLFGKQLIRKDIFIILLSGLFAMIPDINKIISVIGHPVWMNIFWLHVYIDNVLDVNDTVKFGIITIAIAIITLYIYYEKIRVKK